MAKKFGSIELGEAFGGYEIVNIPASKLPQDVASAMGAANGNLLGATYNPIWYVGKQLVNGINHFFIAEDIRATKNKDKSIVGLVINVPPGEGSIKGEGAKVVRIIEEADLSPEVQAGLQGAGIDTNLLQSDDLYGIPAVANSWGADLFVSIHCNAFNGVAKGTETCVYALGTKGAALGQEIQKRLVSTLGTVDRGLKERPGLCVLKRTDMPAILLDACVII